MGKEVITFGDSEVEKRKFHQAKNSVIVLRKNLIVNPTTTKIFRKPK